MSLGLHGTARVIATTMGLVFVLGPKRALLLIGLCWRDVGISQGFTTVGFSAAGHLFGCAVSFYCELQQALHQDVLTMLCFRFLHVLSN